MLLVECVQCHQPCGIVRRGLCDGCYRRAWGNGTLPEVGLPRLRQRAPQEEGLLAICPHCPAGGHVMAYRTDELGRPESYICLDWAHELRGYRFDPEEGRR